MAVSAKFSFYRTNCSVLNIPLSANKYSIQKNIPTLVIFIQLFNRVKYNWEGQNFPWWYILRKIAILIPFLNLFKSVGDRIEIIPKRYWKWIIALWGLIDFKDSLRITSLIFPPNLRNRGNTAEFRLYTTTLYICESLATTFHFQEQKEKNKWTSISGAL